MTAAGMAARDGDSRRTRRRQLVLFSVIAAAVLVVFAFWLAAGGGKAPAPTARIDAELVGPGTAEESWTRRSEARLGTIETRLREMEAENRRMGRENARLQGELRANAEDAKAVIDRQAAVIDGLGRAQAGALAEAAAPGGDLFAPGSAGRSAAGAEPVQGAMAAPALIETFRLDEAEDESGGRKGKPLGTWLPAGSHAQAVVLAGGGCLGRDLEPGRSAPGAAQDHGPGVDRGRGRDRSRGRYRGLHRHWRGACWTSTRATRSCAISTAHGPRPCMPSRAAPSIP